MACNLIVLAVIHASKPLHTPCFRLIGGSAFGAFTVGSFYFTSGVRSLVFYFGAISLDQTRFRCLLRCITGMFGIAFHSFVTCLIGVDRLISLCAPVRYRNLGGRYAITMLSICSVLIIAEVIFMFAMTPLHETIDCLSFTGAANPIASAVYNGLNFFLYGASVVVYFAMACCFYVRSRKYEPGSSEYNVFMKQQTIVMPTVRFLAVSLLVCGVLPEAVIGVTNHIEPTIVTSVLHTVANYMRVISSLVEFIALSTCCKRFRDCMKFVICKR